MTRNVVGIAFGLALCLGGTDAAAAQTRAISGRVTNAAGGPIAGATAAIAGSSVAVLTNAQGEFTIQAPLGPFSLHVRFPGFKRQLIAVSADQSSVAVQMEEDIFDLEAVVISGQATTIAQRNLPNAVATVRAEELVRAPSQTIETALQGKIPGALIQANSGAPGGGVQISLRGVSTINGGVDPLLIVDGLFISNDAIGNNINAITGAAAGGNASNQDNPVNRVADLNPADFERVEVLKGASAAAIYGSQASNGVIIMTSRRGEGGPPKFSLSQRLGQYRVSNFMESRAFADSAEAVTVYSDSALVGQLCNLANNGCPDWKNIEELWSETSLSTETNMSVRGGSEATQYYVSGLVRRDGGIAPGTEYEKQALRLNLDQNLGSRWTLTLRSQVIHSLARRGISNNDNTGTSPYLVFPLTPSFFNLKPAVGNAITDYPNNPFERSNPMQTYAFLENDEDVWRALASGRAEYEAIANDQHNLRFNVIGGFDQFIQRNDIYSPPELEYEPNDGQPGTVVLGKATNTNVNLLVNAIHTFHSGNMQARTAVGVQYVDRAPNFTNLVGQNLPPNQRNVALAPNQVLNQQRQPSQDMGVYLQEEITLMEERLLLAGGVRADRSSRAGLTDEYLFYPKAAASYRFIMSGEDEVKLRAAWGQTGIQPNFFNKFTPQATGTIGGIFGTLPGLNVGDPTIRPERNTELEGGVDVNFVGGRLFANVTAFHKTVTDMLLTQTLAPSTGRATRTINGGKMRNVGLEVGLGYAIVQSAASSVVLRGTFFTNQTKVLELPVPAFQVGGFGTALGAFQIEEGKSATQIIGQEGVVGDANPDFQATFSVDATHRQFGFGMLWDWKQGGDVINLTEFLFDAFGNSVDWNTGAQQRRTDFANGLTQPYVQDASYIKLRELALFWNIPGSATQRLFGSGASTARITLSGRNLIRITDFRGMDPEVSNFGNQAIARNIDVAPFPPNRSFFLTIDLAF